jgi:hypothetical protein
MANPSQRVIPAVKNRRDDVLRDGRQLNRIGSSRLAHTVVIRHGLPFGLDRAQSAFVPPSFWPAASFLPKRLP